MFWTLCVFCFLEFSVLLFCCLVLFFSVSLVCSCVYVHLLSPVLHHPVCRLLSVYFSSCFILKYFLLLSGHLYLLCLIISCISPHVSFPSPVFSLQSVPVYLLSSFQFSLGRVDCFHTVFVLRLFHVHSMFLVSVPVSVSPAFLVCSCDFCIKYFCIRSCLPAISAFGSTCSTHPSS